MIHDPLAMTSSVPSVHNIRICIPRIATTVRICPRLERQTFPTHYCSIDCPWLPPLGTVPSRKGGAKCTLEAQRKKLSFELVACLARAAPRLLINSTNWKLGEAAGESLFITESNLLNCTMSNGANMVLGALPA